MRLVVVCVLCGAALLGCKKEPPKTQLPDDAAASDDAAPPEPDAADERYAGSYALVLPNARVYRDRALSEPTFRTRQDQPTLFRLVAVDKKVATIATLETYDGGGCFPPARGTVGLDIEVFVQRSAVAEVTAERVSEKLRPGLEVILSPGAWIQGGQLRSEDLAVDRSEVGPVASSFSFALDPLPEETESVVLEGLDKRLSPLARLTRAVVPRSSIQQSRTLFVLEHSKREADGLKAWSGCVELHWKQAPAEVPARQLRPSAKSQATASRERGTEIEAGSKVYYQDGTPAGVVARPLEVWPMQTTPEAPRICMRFAGAWKAPRSNDPLEFIDSKPPQPPSHWVLCFDRSE